MPSFLIIQTAFIGDVVLATAVAEKLHQQYPDARIDFMLRKGNEALLQDHPFIKTIYCWDKKNGKLANLWRIARAVRRARYTHVINLHRFAASGFVTFFSGAEDKRGFTQNPFSWCYTFKAKHRFSAPDDVPFIHETMRNQELIEALTNALPAKPVLYPSAADEALMAAYKSRGAYICIAPSSVWFTKKFPAEHWAALIRALPAGYNIYLLSGPEDAAANEEIIQLCGKENVVNLGGKSTLMQSAALMRDAAMNYVNDSGPLHLASATNAAVTAVFCSTHPCYGFGPLSDNSRVVQVEDLYCKPCGLHGYPACPQGHFRCAKDVQIQSLLGWTLKAI